MSEAPEPCDHEWDQTNKCKKCDTYRHSHDAASFSGGAGARSHPLCDEDYRNQVDKLGSR